MNTSLLLTINSWAGKNAMLDKLMVFCAKDLVYIVFAVATVGLAHLAYRREWKPVAYFVATLTVTYGFLQIAASLYADHRPFMDHHLTQLVSHAAGKSFPSDHTTVTTAIALGLLLFTRFRKTGLAVLGAAVVIGFARIFVGIHYPVDIMGGLLTGLAGALAVLAARKLIESSQRPRRVASEA